MQSVLLPISPVLIAERLGLALGEQIVKAAGDTEVAYDMAGQLYASPSGWILLSVPNAIVRGVFASMRAPGIELPPQDSKVPGSPLNAHISVFRKEEIEALGGVDKITERGQEFRYSIGRLKTVVPHGWAAMSRVWFLTVHSPELQDLRRSYGLSSLPNNGEFAFHITVAVRRKGVLGRNEKTKV